MRDIFWGNMLGQPNVVFRAVKYDAIDVHLCRVNVEYSNVLSELSVPRACGIKFSHKIEKRRDAKALATSLRTNFCCGFLRFCHMDKLSRHALETCLENRLQVFWRCAMEQHVWDFRTDFIAAGINRETNVMEAGERGTGRVGRQHEEIATNREEALRIFKLRTPYQLRTSALDSL